MTFLIYLFFASSQASFISTSSFHIVISSPEEEKNYRAQAFMQVSSKRPVWWKETSAACMIEELQWHRQASGTLSVLLTKLPVVVLGQAGQDGSALLGSFYR